VYKLNHNDKVTKSKTKEMIIMNNMIVMMVKFKSNVNVW